MTILSGSTDNRWPVAMRLCTPMKGEQLLIYRSSPSATALIYFKDACETFSEKSTVTFLRSQKINKKIFLLNQSPKPTLKRVSTEAVSTEVCQQERTSLSPGLTYTLNEVETGILEKPPAYLNIVRPQV